jgi:preprotein translocase subunit SecG
MGTTASTNVTTLASTISSDTRNECPGPTTDQTIDLSDITSDCGLVVSQISTVDAQCYIDASIEQIAQAAATTDADTQGGLGFTISANLTETENNLRMATTNQCGDVSQTQAISLSDAQLSGCPVTFAQDATANQMCQINFLESQTAKIDAATTSKTSGMSIWGIVIIVIIVGIILLAILVGAGIFISKNPQLMKGGGKQKGLTWAIIILILVIIIVAIMLDSRTNNITKITPVEKLYLKKSMREATELANLSDNSVWTSDASSKTYDEPKSPWGAIGNQYDDQFTEF